MNPLDGFRFGATLDGPLSDTPATDATPPDAPSILIAAADTIGNRASERDHASGERSMARAVAMFNAWRGDAPRAPLTETEGWVFMALLKLARSAGGRHKLDDYIDGAAYIALAGESAEAAYRFAAPQS